MDDRDRLRTNFLIDYLLDEQGVGIESVLDDRRDVARIIAFAEEKPPGWERS